MSLRFVAALVAAQVLILVPSTLAQDHEVPPGFEVVSVARGYNVPVDLAFMSDGTFFLVQKTGRVSYFDQTGAVQSEYFIDLTFEVNNSFDRGMLAMALSPGFVPDGGPDSWVYLLYTVSPVPGQDWGFDQNDQYSFSRLTRYRAETVDGDLVADLSSRQVLLGSQLPDGSVPDAIASMHVGHSNGSMFFGSDGSLLLATGDGAHWDFTDTGGNDEPGFDTFVHPQTNLKGPIPDLQDSGALRAQDLRSLSGKVLRLDPETGFGLSSNPFFDGDPTSHASRVWALGLRVPHRMSLIEGTGVADPLIGDPGVIVIGEVGQGQWEELNVCRGGENFGWPCFEGSDVRADYTNFDPGPLDIPDCQETLHGVLTFPDLGYHHWDPLIIEPPGVYVDDQGLPLPGFDGRCAIGGATYPGGSYPAEYTGRYFFSDYAFGWVKTVEIDANSNIVAVRDFGTNMGAIVKFEANPVSGELFMLDLAEQSIFRLRYGNNLTPVPMASASPSVGPAPLDVQFTGSGSLDPDLDPLDFLWDFGDNSPGSMDADPMHTYLTNGIYQAELTVTDPGGLSASTELIVGVGDGAPGVAITSPLQGDVFDEGELLVLTADAVDPNGGLLTYDWTIDLIHDSHVHPESFSSTDVSPSFSIEAHGGIEDLIYYRVDLTVEDDEGLTASDHVYIFPETHLLDVTGTSLPISRVAELSPPVPTGGGNLDIEVVRDGVEPPVGSGDHDTAFATEHGGDQGSDDWLGYELTFAPGPELNFVSLRFQEGLHDNDGGWWIQFDVEVRDGGVWTPVDNLMVTPAYPFELSGMPGFDGVDFQTYELRFDPTQGDAVRLRGSPGGNGGYVSVAELRARIIDRLPTPDGYVDVTSSGVIAAELFSLSPPTPLGSGSTNPETIRNGTLPPTDSTSTFAQFDTFHNGDQGSREWIGYVFPTSKSLSRLVFQEGLQNAAGGAFRALEVEILDGPGGSWLSVDGLTVNPPYPGLDGDGYETFTLDFDPVQAFGLRLIGDLAGSVGYLSLGELRAWGQVGPPWINLLGGSAGAAGIPALVGLGDPTAGGTISLRLHDGPPNDLTLLWISLSSFPLNIFGGTLAAFPFVEQVLLPTNSVGAFAGAGLMPPVIPVGTEIWFQCLLQDLSVNGGVILSNATKATVQ